MTAERLGVVGAGIVGLAVARQLGRQHPDANVTVVEKEDAVGRHQTGRNSGVVHAGLYYPPGSLKSRLCARGRMLLREYCEEQGLPYDECGKLVVAAEAREVGALQEIERRARAAGVPDLAWLSAGQLTAIEPHARGVAALHSPHTAITDFGAVARSYAADVQSSGGQLHLGQSVIAVRGSATGVVVRAASGREWEFDRLVICAGLYSDRVAGLAGDSPEPAIVPFRGEYLRLVPARRHLVSGLIYPVPDPRYPFLGVHFTRRVSGAVDIGPNAVIALAREGYGWGKIDPSELWAMLNLPAFRHLATRHWRAGLKELWSSLWRPAFLAAARRYVPELSGRDVERAPAGVRAQAVDDDGTLVDDFRIGQVRLGRGSVVAVRNAPSPAATSSLAIAEHLTDLVFADA